jgi:hypothetical protein
MTEDFGRSDGDGWEQSPYGVPVSDEELKRLSLSPPEKVLDDLRKLRAFSESMFEGRAPVSAYCNHAHVEAAVQVLDKAGVELGCWAGTVRECHAFLFGWATAACY